MGFAKIKAFVQEYADTVAEVLGLEVTVLDQQGVRICGTGAHQQLIGKPVPTGSFFETILHTGQPGMILETKKNESECQKCQFIEHCTELATIGFPVFKKNEIAGVIGIVGFNFAQKEAMIHDADKLLAFLSHMSSLLEHKLLLIDVLQSRKQPSSAHRDVGSASDKDTCFIHEEKRGNPAGSRITFDQMIGQSRPFKEVLAKANKIKNSPSTVLLLGESGTGKELLAQAIHNEGNRRDQPFVVVNCAAIPEHLLESELFGYEGGAYTGAKREGRRGKLEMAHKGTIFLDEIGDLPLALQPKLLRALQEKTVERVGGNHSIPVDIRVIAATHRNLDQMVGQGLFRHDLYYRIHVIPLHMPTLHARRGDISALIRHFIHKYSTLLGKEVVGLDPDLERWMHTYTWPGNVRQFENAVEYMVNMTESVILGLNDLPPNLLHLSEAVQQIEDLPLGNVNAENESRVDNLLGEAISGLIEQNKEGLEQLLSLCEKEILAHYMQLPTYQQDKGQLARLLNVSLSTLYRKLDKFGL
ncbi:sigma-54 interaction domain-containing protein [Bacillus horti]|uniref:Transcriptional regulator with PAS, ATPase and Fis domain n=1 Tax=Caldalkalibacillus horti TaxID=77523 RepID=A0ABT9VVN7_9BACI|nr:sigma 54-interacting transcriptional regulator [Bacillus horti]MDQ0165053.1 transcriptional regulator with PAS, ATPase and Fis domain [Bacillus horti]